MTEQARWLRVRDVHVPADGRVRSVVVDGRSIAMSRCGGRLEALENKCPHQGGPLGEESIEKGLLRCPWHGYDYDPLTGLPPEGFADAVPGYLVQERPDGVYVALPEVQTSPRTVADVRVETLVAFGVRHVFGMVGHSKPRPAPPATVRRLLSVSFSVLSRPPVPAGTPVGTVVPPEYSSGTTAAYAKPVEVSWVPAARAILSPAEATAGIVTEVLKEPSAPGEILPRHRDHRARRHRFR